VTDTIEAEKYREYRAQGVPEDTAEILAHDFATGRVFVPPAPDVDELIAAAEARAEARVCLLRGRHRCTLHRGHNGDCVELCAVHPFGVVEADDEMCAIVPVEARHGHLCGPCYGRARNDLHQVPQLLAHIRGQVVPSLESARGPRVSGTREAPIPLRPDPVDDADDLYASVVNWIVSFARQTGTRPPATVIAFLKASTDAARLPSWARDQASAYTLADDLVRWYEAHELQIVTALPPLTVKAWCEDIGAIVGSFRSRYPQADRKPRQARPRECPTCGEHAVVAVFYAAGVEVSCAHCGEVFPESQHDDLVDWAETLSARSVPCSRGRHKQCESFHCACDCHDYAAA
jgi:hypothetical protein